MQNKKNNQKGFTRQNFPKKISGGYTIIETMISVSLFLIIVMVGMNTLLNASLLHQKSQDMRSILDNLSFIMEDMGRNLRTGSNYYCINDNRSASADLGFSKTLSGQNCWGIVFKPANGGPQWGYEVVSQTMNGVTTYFIQRSTDNGATWVQLTPDEVTITGYDVLSGIQVSGFSVLGAEPPSAGDQQQPFVTIRLVGTITSKGVATPFSLQTSVSQRNIDIN